MWLQNQWFAGKADTRTVPNGAASAKPVVSVRLIGRATRSAYVLNGRLRYSIEVATPIRW